MKKANLPIALSLIIFGGLALFSLSNSSRINAAATHIVISQIQSDGLGSGHANDEFVELYNPTSSTVDLTGWKLKEENSTNTSSANLVASMSGSIASHGYFLIGSPTFTTITPDEIYSATSSSFTAKSTIVLSDSTNTLTDKVGMGTAVDKETTDAPPPAAGGSIERTIDDTGGHGTDTDNNSADFVSLATSDPRNSSTVVSTATPTSTPTSTPTDTPTPSATPTATPPATPTSTPTAIPTSTPTMTPTSTPTLTPTATPTIIPTSTPTSTPITTPTPSSSTSPTNFPFPFPMMTFTCKVNYITLNFGFGITIRLPQIFCGFNLK